MSVEMSVFPSPHLVGFLAALAVSRGMRDSLLFSFEKVSR